MYLCFCRRVQPARYCLEHNKRSVDLSLPLRFANIPANAVVELVLKQGGLAIQSS